MVALVAVAALGCDDSTAPGEPTDTSNCTGATCGDFFRDVEDTSPPDTAPDTTEPDTRPTCVDGETQCVGLDATRMSTCVNGEWEESECLDGELCKEDTGVCTATLCPAPGLAVGCETDTQERVCGQDQFSFDVRDCLEGDICVGSGCVTQVCVPRARRCRTIAEPEVCNDSGTAYESAGTCAEDERCDTNSGQCLSICEAFTKDSTSYEGCEYFVLDMDNFSDVDDTEFGITISNGGNIVNIPATVVITGPAGFSRTVSVPPRSLVQVPLPSTSDVDASGVHQNASFYVQSNVPISVHQFNPLNQSGVASNDASLLLPVNALGTDYLALSYPARNGFEEGRPYVDVIGTENNTTVTVVSPVTIQGGPGFGNIPANVPTNITVNRGELIHLLANAVGGADVSGMQIVSDKPVAVFSGSRCANIPDGVNYCDHLEQQLFPTNTWGQEYFAAKFAPRGTEPDVWRIIARENDTVVTFDPPQGGSSTVTLQRGQVHQVITAADFKITGDKPILVGQFMVGSTNPGIPLHPSCSETLDVLGLGGGGCDSFTCEFLFGGVCHDGVCAEPCTTDASCQSNFCAGDPTCSYHVFCDGYCKMGTGIGDPAFALAVPSDQYRSDYIVMVPSGYEENYMTLISSPGAVPRIDNMPVNGPPYNASPISINGERDVYRLRVGEGVHTLISTSGSVGVSGYGYACDVSYAYPGGLNLEIIN